MERSHLYGVIKKEIIRTLRRLKSVSGSDYTRLGLVDKNATPPTKNQSKVFWLFVMPTISEMLCIHLTELEISNII